MKSDRNQGPARLRGLKAVGVQMRNNIWRASLNEAHLWPATFRANNCATTIGRRATLLGRPAGQVGGWGQECQRCHQARRIQFVAIRSGLRALRSRHQSALTHNNPPGQVWSGRPANPGRFTCLAARPAGPSPSKAVRGRPGRK